MNINLIRKQQQTPEEIRHSAHVMITEIESKFKQPVLTKQTDVPVSFEEEVEKARLFVEAKEVQFDIHTGALPDERLYDLAKTFRRFNYEKVYRISFAAFVKARISGRWQEKSKDDRPATTILPKYKLPVQMRYGGLVLLPTKPAKYSKKFSMAAVIGIVLLIIIIPFVFH